MSTIVAKGDNEVSGTIFVWVIGRLDAMQSSKNIEKKVILGLVVIFMISVFSSWVMIASLHQVYSADHWVMDYNSNGLIQSERLRYFAEAMISNTRGYLLTLDENAFLPKIYESRQRFHDLFTKMNQETLPDRPVLAEKKDILRQIALTEREYEEVLDRAFALRENEGSLQETRYFLSHKVPAIRETLNQDLDKLVHLESKFLDIAKKDAEKIEVKIRRTLNIVFIALIFILSGMMFFIGRFIREGRDLLDKARRAVRARDEVLAVVSHDLKNPLAAISLNVQLLIKNSPEPIKKIALMIERSSNAMKILIQELLDNAKLEAGYMTLELKDYEITSIWTDLKMVLAPLATQKGIHLEFGTSSPDLRVYCDRQGLIQIISNLVGNAIKFTGPKGNIFINAYPRPDALVIEVRDTGPGILPDEIPHLFDRYWQSKQTARQGTGLGLSIVKGLVEAHGGQIWVKSHPGQGSTFIFTLPWEKSKKVS